MTDIKNSEKIFSKLSEVIIGEPTEDASTAVTMLFAEIMMQIPDHLHDGMLNIFNRGIRNLIKYNENGNKTTTIQ